MGGKGRLQPDHAFRGGIQVRGSGEAEHGPDMVPVGGHHGGELLFAVVRLIRQPEASLAGVQQDPVRITRVGCRVDVEKPRYVRTEEFSGQFDDVRRGLRGVDGGEPFPDGFQAFGFYRGFIHEAVVKIPDLLFDAGGFFAASGGFFDDFPDRQLGAVPQGGESAFKGAVVRDGRALQPRAVDVLVQVILRPHGVVDIGQVDPRVWHKCSFR